MVQLFKDAFKGKKADAAKAESAQSFDPKAQTETAVEAAPETKKKPKHGEDGVCCGGCH